MADWCVLMSITALMLLGCIAAGVSTGPPSGETARSRNDWYGILGTGQSLSIGVAGLPPLSTRQPFHNLKLSDSGPDPKYPLSGSSKLSLIPLTEPMRPPLLDYADREYPNNIAGETPHAAMANQISALALAETGRDYLTLHSEVGCGNCSLVEIGKHGPGRAYAGSLMEANAFRQFADRLGKRFAYGAIVLTHGETDALNPDYGAQVLQLWQDYNQDLKAITGQSEDISMLISQQSTVPGGPAVPLSPQAVWRLSVEHPGQILCTGPKYQYPYASGGLHLTAGGYRRLGEKYAQVYYQAVVQGRPWKPLQPQQVSRAGRDIRVSFDVPVPPLAWEETLPLPHQGTNIEWMQGRGFEVESSVGRQSIEGVRIDGDVVIVSLAQEPAGTGLVVRYAMTQDGADEAGGTDAGRMGQLRDSDPFVGQDAQMVTCQLSGGSAVALCPIETLDRIPSDIVQSDFLAPGTVLRDVRSAPTGQSVILMFSQPWSGPDGLASLSLHYDQRNYAVQFELPVP